MKAINRRKVLKLGFGFTATGIVSGFKSIDNPISDSTDKKVTARQELGPFPPMKYRGQLDKDIDLTVIQGHEASALGKAILVKGRVTDTDGHPVEKALVEIWQANHRGVYHHEFDKKDELYPNFQGWGQVLTGNNGEYSFKTIIPGKYDNRTRHIHYKINRRGYHELVTQLYFEGEEKNETDGLYNALTAEEQKSVTFELDHTQTIPEIQFNITINKVIAGRLPEKVLMEYNGNYNLKFKEEPFEDMLNSLLNGPYQSITVDVSNKGEQLFFNLPFAPVTEVLWKSKDRFDATSFYRSDVVFKRDNTGKVTKMIFEFQDGMKSVTAQKM